jgi:hypothetical protein
MCLDRENIPMVDGSSLRDLEAVVEEERGDRLSSTLGSEL